ncbi:MAG: hypothetical protein Q8O67_24315 [Deltaproteobacteria bacterium]|nr:hypothetical protein [Deltaproteobacteria bacterium]
MPIGDVVDDDDGWHSRCTTCAQEPEVEGAKMVAAIHAEESLALPDALDRLALAAERTVSHAATLIAKALATSVLTVGVALLLGTVAWLSLMAGGAFMLAERAGPGGALLIVAGLQAVVAAAMVLATGGALGEAPSSRGGRR